MLFRSYYDEVQERHGDIDCSGDPGMTKQEFKEECDINTIMRQMTDYGVTPTVRDGAMYGDFSDVGDFMTAQRRVEEARADFESLPSKVRERFNNDPARLIEFLSIEANRAEAIELGLVNKPVEPDPAAVPVVVKEAKPPVA